MSEFSIKMKNIYINIQINVNSVKQGIPNTRRVAVAFVELALFLAVHLYVPAMSFETFFNLRNDLLPLYSTTAPWGRSPSPLKVHLIVGFGKPVALQLMFAGFPSGIVWFEGDTTAWGDSILNEQKLLTIRTKILKK